MYSYDRRRVASKGWAALRFVAQHFRMSLEQAIRELSREGHPKTAEALKQALKKYDDVEDLLRVADHEYDEESREG